VIRGGKTRIGRPPKSDQDEQLAKAMELFWRKGYFDTSIDEVVAATGANRYGLYASYGDKRGLFDKVLEVYRTEVMAGFLAPLGEDDAALPEIQAFFARFLAFVDEPRGRLGCLMCATASEVAPHDPLIAKRIEAYLADLRRALRAAAGRATAKGQVVGDADPDEIADYLVGAVLGLMSYARSPAPRVQVRHYLRGVLRFLEGLAVPAVS